MKRRLAIALLALLAGVACTGSDSPCANLPGGGRYCLQPTSALPPFDVQQKVNIAFDERRETVIVELEVDADGMRCAALTPFGATLMQAGYDNRQARTGAWPDQRLQPELMLALLQLALWPAESVRAGLDGTLTLDESGGLRRFTAAGETILTIIRGATQYPIIICGLRFRPIGSALISKTCRAAKRRIWEALIKPRTVIPAKAGIQYAWHWTPAFAGVTAYSAFPEPPLGGAARHKCSDDFLMEVLC